MGALTIYMVRSGFLHSERYFVDTYGQVHERTRSIFAPGTTTSSDTRIHRFITDSGATLKEVIRSAAAIPVYYRDSFTERPWWRTFWDIPEDLHNRSVDVLVVVEVGSRLFVATHGHARHMLNPHAVVYDFGLRTALNVLDEEKLRSAEVFVPSEIAMRTRMQPGKQTSIDDYDINVLNSLLKQVGGSVRDEYADYFKVIDGADSIRFPYSGSPAELTPLLARLSEQYDSNGYARRGFAWIDNFRPVRDRELVLRLDAALLERLSSASEDVLLVFPEVMPSASVVAFRYRRTPSRKHSSSYFPTLDFTEQYFPILQVGGTDLSIEDVKHHQIEAVDLANDNRHISTYSAYQCLYCEVGHANRLYMLESGTWYHVNDDFHNDLDRRLAPLLSNPFPLGFPYHTKDINQQSSATHSSKEYIYNQGLTSHLSASGVSQLLDSDLVSTPTGKVEICDVLFRDIQSKVYLIHNKYKYGSSALSHLFAQGYVSASLITEPSFRALANKKIRSPNLAFPTTATIDRRDYVVVYGIISKKRKRGGHTIPLFSRINLDIANTNLARLGYGVMVSIIDVA